MAVSFFIFGKIEFIEIYRYIYDKNLWMYISESM